MRWSKDSIEGGENLLKKKNEVESGANTRSLVPMAFAEEKGFDSKEERIAKSEQNPRSNLNIMQIERDKMNNNKNNNRCIRENKTAVVKTVVV